MKSESYVPAMMLALLLAGCPEYDRKQQLNNSRINAETINSLNNIAIENAIIRQQTLFEYHFINNSEKLNALGEKDLGILAAHFRENPGNLNLQRGNISEELYRARVDFALAQLEQAGVASERISVTDAMAGGDGMSSQRLIQILSSESVQTEQMKTQVPAGHWSGIEK